MTKLTRETVLEYLAQNPGDTNKRDIAKGLGVSGESRLELRLILKQLEDEGVISRIGKPSFSRADAPPPTGVVEFERIDEHGELIGRAVGKDGKFGPDIIYAGPKGRRNKSADPGEGDRALCDIEQSRDGSWSARLIKKFDKRQPGLLGVFEAHAQGGRVVSTSRKDQRTLIIFHGDHGDARDGDLVRAEEKTNTRGHGPRRGVITEVIGQDQTNDVSHIFIVEEFGDAEPRMIKLVSNARIFHLHACTLGASYAVKFGIMNLRWKKDLTYAWA